MESGWAHRPNEASYHLELYQYKLMVLSSRCPVYRKLVGVCPLSYRVSPNGR